MDVRAALKQGIGQLRAAKTPSFTIAAELLLLHSMGRDRAWLYAHPEELLAPDQSARFFSLIARRVAGEPTQYLTGQQEFWGLQFEVTPDVLIPRPETEHVVEVALDRLALRELRSGRPQNTNGNGLQIGDIGTGSGCIAVALARQLPKATILATDISTAALAVALRNAQKHGVADRIRLLEANLLDFPVGSQGRGAFHLIASNPPYVGRCDSQALGREIRDHEPAIALYGGEEGYELYAPLISGAAPLLAPGGVLVLELGHDSLPAVQPLPESPLWCNVGITNDLAGIPRVIAAERTSSSV